MFHLNCVPAIHGGTDSQKPSRGADVVDPGAPACGESTIVQSLFIVRPVDTPPANMVPFFRRALIPMSMPLKTCAFSSPKLDALRTSSFTCPNVARVWL